MKHENLLSQMLCRICGTEQTSDTMNNLFTSVHNGLYFVDILEECLQKSVTRDNGFPLNICLDCTSNLIVVYNFRLIAFDSEKKFKQMLDSDGFYKNVELFVEETETDVKPSYFIDCAAIEELNTNCDERQDTKTEMVVNESGKLKVESYECYLCKETYRRIDNLRRHFRTCHRITENLWSCSDCQKRLSSRKHLVKHLYKHRTPACDYCPETFTTFRLLQQHCQQTHSNELVLHQCVQCPKKFALRAQFDMHKHLHNQRNNQDNHNAPFNCTSCSETFTTATQLKAHTRALHTTHLCSECGKTFKNNSLLVSHQKVHKSEKPFVCSRCPSRFKWKVALTYHMTIHDQERKHVCETCGKSFSTRSAMKGHMSELQIGVLVKQ